MIDMGYDGYVPDIVSNHNQLSLLPVLCLTKSKKQQHDPAENTVCCMQFYQKNEDACQSILVYDFTIIFILFSGVNRKPYFTTLGSQVASPGKKQRISTSIPITTA